MSLRRRRRSRLRQFWAVALVVLGIAIVAGYLLARWPGFSPHHVRVIGNRVVPTAEILAHADVDFSGNMWLENTGAMASRVERIPYIRTARIYRRPPATITIAVTERSPFANVRSGAQTVLVDRALRVLGVDEDPTLPTLTLDATVSLVPAETLQLREARVLRDTLVGLRARGADVTELAIQNGEVTATLQGGVRVLLGDEGSAGLAVPLVEPILTRFALLGRPVTVLDLRSPTTPVVTESAPAGTRRPKARTTSPSPRAVNAKGRGRKRV